MKKLFFALVIALTAVTSAQAQTKVAHVNSQKLLDTMPSRKQAIAEINEIERRGSEELQIMNDNLQKEYNIYMSKKATQSAQMNEYDEGRLSKMNTDLQNRQQEIEALLQKMSAELNDEILKTVKEAVALVAKKKGYNYIIDESSTLFATGPDVTNEIIPDLIRIDTEKLNKKKAATGTQGTPVPPKTN